MTTPKAMPAGTAEGYWLTKEVYHRLVDLAQARRVAGDQLAQALERLLALDYPRGVDTTGQDAECWYCDGWNHEPDCIWLTLGAALGAWREQSW